MSPFLGWLAVDRLDSDRIHLGFWFNVPLLIVDRVLLGFWYNVPVPW